MAVICRISGFWSSKAVLLVSFSISVPCTETLASKPLMIPQMKWAGNSFLLISALVGSLGWKKEKKKLLFALHICPDVPGSCLLHQWLRITSAHHRLPDSRLRSGGQSDLHRGILIFFFSGNSAPSLPATWTGTEEKKKKSSRVGIYWTRAGTKLPIGISGG